MTLCNRRAFVGGAVLSILPLGAGAQAGVWVITTAEAAMPPSQASRAGRSITRGPAIRQVSPAGPVASNQPFPLKVDFAARGGEKINPASAQVRVLRGGTVDVTQRLAPFIRPTGIDVPNAMVPPGTYVIEVAVSDAGGRQSVANIEIDAK